MAMCYNAIMSNHTIKTGDFVAQMNPAGRESIKKGIVTSSTPETFEVQWLTYNKTFWLEDEGDPAIVELNRTHLLTKMSYYRKNEMIDIVVLNANRVSNE